MMIIIIGKTNSGKTTLSIKLSDRFGLKYEDFDRGLFLDFVNSNPRDTTFETFYKQNRHLLQFEDNSIINLYTDDILRFLDLDCPFIIKIYLDNKRCSQFDLKMMKQYFSKYFQDLDWDHCDKYRTDDDILYSSSDSFESLVEKIEQLIKRNETI